MKTEQEYKSDLKEIRSMMERSTRFLSLTGWSGILAGIYALLGAFAAWRFFYLKADPLQYNTIGEQQISLDIFYLFSLGLLVLVLAIGTAILLSYRKYGKKGERLWNPAARRLIFHMAIPLVSGGIFIIILFSKGLIGLIPAMTLIFYGLALVNASKFTFEDVKYLGIVQIGLGLIASAFIGYGLLFWAIGFGIMHIVYGIYMHLKYEK